MRIFRAVFLTFGVLTAGSLLGLSAFVLWVLASTGGARWVLETLAETGLAEVRADAVQGQLLGPLELHGLHYRGPGVEVSLDRVRLDWSPAALLRREVRIDALRGGVLDVRLSPTEPDPVPRTEPLRLPQLPIAIRIDEVRVETLRLWQPGVETPEVVAAIEADQLRWQPDRLQAGRLSARHALTGLLQATLDAALAPDAVDLRVLDLRLPEIEGETAPRLSASGPVGLDPLTVDLRLGWQSLRWPLAGEPQVTSRQGRAHVHGDLQDLRLEAELALGDKAQVEAQGRYGAEALSADLRWKHLQWPLNGSPQVASASGRFQVEGQPEAYRYTLEAELAAEGQKGRAQAKGSGGLQHVVLETLRLAVARATVEGRARVDWNLGETAAVAVDADLDVRQLNPGLIAPDWPGRINGRLKARTQIENEVPRAQFEVTLRDSELRGYPLRLEARGRSEATTVVLEALNLRSARTTLRAEGQVTPPLDVRAELDSPDLGALWPGLEGRAQLKAAVRGELDAPHAVVDGQVRGLVYDTLHIERVDLDADVALAGAWQLDLDLRDLSGPTAVQRARVQLDGRDAEHTLRLSVDAEPAQAELALQGALDRRAWRWRGTLASGRVTPEGLAPWVLEAPAALSLAAQSVDLEPACWAATDSRACGRLLLDQARLRAAFRLERLDFAYFAPFLPDGLAMSGSVDGLGLVELRDGRLTEARTRLSTAPLTVQRDGQTLLEAGAGSLRVSEEEGLATVLLDLPIENGRLRLDARLGTEGASEVALDQRPVQARLEVGLDDLDWLRLTTEEVERVEGRIQGHLEWTGTLAALESQGELRLIDGQVALSTPGIEVREIGLALTAQGQALGIDGSARSGDGVLTLTGRAALQDGQPQVELALRGENFQAADMTMARAWISPKLDLSLAGQRLDVKGEIAVPRAEITPVDFEGGVGPSGDQIIITGEDDPGARDGGLQVFADVLLRLGDAVRFEGFGLTTRLTGSVRATEQPGRPGTGRGEVRLIDGHYQAYGQELDIQTGRLLFTGGPLTQPAVEIRAVRKPRDDIEVGVLVRGTLDQPQFQLFSTPSMPRERQLSWLVLGRSIDEGGGGEGERAMLANAALSLGLGGTDRLAQGLRGGLGLDEISIGARPGEDAQKASLTVGKYLSPKLYVSYGVGIFQPGQIFRLLYDLGRGFKVATESGVHTGGDLLYSVERP